jgi:HlyD family secretion protein
LRQDDRGASVFLLREGRAVRRQVELGERVAGQQQVLSGVSAGDRVVLEPAAALQDGQNVSE